MDRNCSSRKVTVEPFVSSKEYLETARPLVRVARIMAHETRLVALAEDYEATAKEASHTDTAIASALQVGAAKGR
jgi:hypothetical protein